jgi:hypothetical protein
MASKKNYNKNNNRSNSNYNGNRNNNSGGYANNNKNSNQAPKKKSGARMSEKNGKPFVTGWNVSQSRGYITFIAFPYEKTKRVVSDNGVEWENWMIKINSQRNIEPILKPCLMEVATGRILCKELNLMANPKANNGGYFGKMM